MSKPQSPSRFAVILAFGLVYLFWGSTYLAIDIAVQSIPPALMCGLRFSIAGVVMLAACAITGRRIFYSAKQIALSAIVGILLLMGGNLTLSWAELSVPSGLAALIVAITPLWFLVLDSLLLGHHRISWRGKAGLALGIVGLFVLFWPELHSTSPLGHREFIASIALLGGSFSWALGSVLSKRWQSGMDVFSATGWQVTAAGAANFLWAIAAGDFNGDGIQDLAVAGTTGSGGAVAILHTIETRQVAAAFCGSDNIVGGEGVIGCRERALLGDSTKRD